MKILYTSCEMRNLAGGLHFRPVVLGFLPLVHQAGGFEDDLPPQFLIGHEEGASIFVSKPIKATPGMVELYAGGGGKQEPRAESGKPRGQAQANERRTAA